MTTVIPPPPPPPPGPIPAPAPSVTVVNPPPPLAQLPIGTLIEATLLGAGPKGLIQARTEFGNLNLQTNIALPENGSVELQIEKLTPQLLLQLKAINGKALGRPGRDGQFVQSQLPQAGQQKGGVDPGMAQQSTQSAQLASSGAAGVGAPGSQAAVSLDIGTMLKAVVLRQPAPPGSQQTAGQIGRAGASGATPTGSVGPASTAGAPVAQSVQAAPGGPIQPGAQANTPVVGTQANLRVLSLTPESQISTILTNASHHPGANAMSGRVVGSTPNGSTLVQTKIGLLALETRSPLPARSTISFEVSGKMEPPRLGGSLNAAQDIFLSREWPRLEEAFGQLRQTAPEALQQLLNNTVPRGNSQLSTNILFFLNALRGGNIRFWLGGGASGALERDRPDLMGRIGEDFNQLSRTFSEPSASGWRTAMVPFYTGENLEQVRMHTKARGHEDEDEDEDSSRFIIDVEMSRLGRIQLDGLIKGKSKRFDLIFRSTEPLPSNMRKDINLIFVDSAEAAGVNGAIIFQAHTKFVEIPLMPDAKGAETGLIV